MSVEWVAGLMVVIAIAAIGGATWLFFRESWFMQWLRGSAGFLLVGIALYLVLLAASLFGYQQSQAGVPLATVSFVKKDAQSWDVTVAELDGQTRVFELLGDLWEMDVRLLRYSGIGGIFGSDPSFLLERLSGRYLALEDEAGKDKTEYRLLSDSPLGFDVWENASENGSVFVSAVRSNVSLVPIADGAIYEVVFGEDGLLTVRPANSVAEDARKSVE